MPRVAEFLEEVGQVLERIPTARAAGETFLAHKGSTTFRDSPAGGRDGFAVGLDSQPTTLEGFGREKQKMLEVFVLLELGHFPTGPNDERERSIAEDVERISDVLEAKADWSQGSGGAVDLVRCETRGRTERANPNWWITPLIFRVVLWSPSWHE